MVFAEGQAADLGISAYRALLRREQHLKHSLDVKSNRPAALESMIAHFSNAANRRDQNIAASAIRRAVAMLRRPGVPQGVNRQLRGSQVMTDAATSIDSGPMTKRSLVTI